MAYGDKRKISKYNQVEKHYVFTNGECTEINYFNGLKSYIGRNAIYRYVIIYTHFKNSSCLGLVKETKKYIDINNIIFSDIWCVFDKDNFNDFDDAIKLLEKYNKNDNKKNSYHALWSNLSFELWIMLHFQYNKSACNNSEYIEKLNKIFKKVYNKCYDKNDEHIFIELINGGNYKKAVKYAKKLLENRGKKLPSKINPGTTVYEFIEKVEKYFL